METILIQEANAATLDVVTTALQMEGYKVCSVADKQENILELIRRHRPKLVLLDCWLGHYSGRQISHWIKSHFPNLPVIAFSCDSQIDREYQQYGFDGYVKKPFDLQTLYNVIKKNVYARQKHKRSVMLS
jgi:DNA-binding response OmpR family regulator